MQTIKTLLALGFLATTAAGCGGGSLFGGAAPSAPKANEPSAPSQNGSADSQSPDSENTTANQPVPVAGMYLTMSCGAASGADGANTVADQNSYGCEVENADASRFAGMVNFSNVTVSFTAATQMIPTLGIAAAGSKWHVVFNVPSALASTITSFAGTGYVNQTQRFNLTQSVQQSSAAPASTSQPASSNGSGSVNAAALTGFISGIAAVSAALATPAAPAAPAPAPCVPPKYNYDYPSMKAAVMDAVSALTTGHNGLPPQQIIATTLLAGDVLKYTSPASNRISITEVNGTQIVTYTACPNAWHINFKDASGALMQTTNIPDVYAFAAGIAVPAGAATAWLGFYEPHVYQYNDNEGFPGVAEPVGNTDGCDFQFELDRAKCGT